MKCLGNRNLQAKLARQTANSGSCTKTAQFDLATSSPGASFESTKNENTSVFNWAAKRISSLGASSINLPEIVANGSDEATLCNLSQGFLRTKA
jgi:hypothetical protein